VFFGVLKPVQYFVYTFIPYCLCKMASKWPPKAAH